MDARPPVDYQALVDLFFDDPSRLGQLTLWESGSLPVPYAELLAHEHHMTVTVESFYRQSVSVEVLDVSESSQAYARKILLRGNENGQVVQFGIVRLHLPTLPAKVQKLILSQEIPLGRVLIEHDVMRQVELVSVWQVAVGAELAAHFGVPAGTVTFGRTAWIHFGDDTAVELLEIVAPVPTIQ